MEALILRFDAPLMSFGGVMVDHHNVTDRFPGVSMLTGLLANALGWRHADAEKLDGLQDRLVIASRWDIEPVPLTDYQTVDLGQPHLSEPGWTTRGEPQHRDGGEASEGTHQRYRHHWANGVMTLAVALTDDRTPTVDDLERALKAPARPLFIGRKACLPAVPIFHSRVTAPDIRAALAAAPRAERLGKKPTEPMPARWPAELGAVHGAQIRPVYDRRDWRAQWHAGQTLVAEGLL